MWLLSDRTRCHPSTVGPQHCGTPALCDSRPTVRESSTMKSSRPHYSSWWRPRGNTAPQSWPAWVSEGTWPRPPNSSETGLLLECSDWSHNQARSANSIPGKLLLLVHCLLGGMGEGVDLSLELLSQPFFLTQKRRLVKPVMLTEISLKTLSRRTGANI